MQGLYGSSLFVHYSLDLFETPSLAKHSDIILQTLASKNAMISAILSHTVYLELVKSFTCVWSGFFYELDATILVERGQPQNSC